MPRVILTKNGWMNGSTNNNAFFNVDWALLLKPNTPYHLSFTYQGGQNISQGYAPFLWINFATMMNYEAENNGSANTTNIVGMIRPVVFNTLTDAVLHLAELHDNFPCYLENRPSSIFNLKITYANGDLWTDANDNLPADWYIILHFNEVKNRLPNKQILFSSGYIQPANTLFYMVNINHILDPAKKYKVHFVFNSNTSSVAVPNFYYPRILSCNFNAEMYQSSSNAKSTSKINIMGYLNMQTYGFTAPDTFWFYANRYDNAPIELDCKQTGNLNIQILDYNGGLINDNFLVAWSCIMNFQEIKNQGS